MNDSNDEYDIYLNEMTITYDVSSNLILKNIVDEHTKYVKDIINNQPTHYDKLLSFFNGSYETTTIPELKLCIDYLKIGLTIDFINRKCTENNILNKLRESLYCSIFAITSDEKNSYFYGPTIRVIFKILDFYDIIIRSIKNIPNYYHKYRYERYLEYCISCAKKGLFIFPTFYNIGATDLIKLRPYPIFPVGLCITLNYVDEFLQSPSEFFIHDINHIRRMFESNISDMVEKNIDIDNFNSKLQYYNESYECLQQIMKIIKCTIQSRNIDENDNNYIQIYKFDKSTNKKELTKIGHLFKNNYSDIDYDEPIDTGYAQLIKIIIFEITHEDAMPLQKDVICKAIQRQSGIDVLFPRINTSGKITINSEKSGSILGFVKYKLRYNFFDTDENPLDMIVNLNYRTDKHICIAVQILLKKLCNTTLDEQEYYNLIINIIDKSGLNTPVHSDILNILMPEILSDKLYGDYSNEEIEYIKSMTINSYNINNFTGIRPNDVSEQGNLITKIGGKFTLKKKK
jgi:hypothetical protein